MLFNSWLGVGEVEAEGGEAGVELPKEADFGLGGWGGEGDAEAEEGVGFIPRHGGDELFADEPLRGVFCRVELDALSVGLGDCPRGGGVEEEGAFGFDGVKAQRAKSLNEAVHSAGVFGGDGFGDFRMVEAPGGSVLDGEELAGVGVVFDVAVCLDKQGVAGDEAAAPAGHVEGFAEGMEFESDFFGAGDGEEAQWFSFKEEGGVGGVVDDDELALFGEFDNLGEELGCGNGTAGIVGVVEDEDFGFLEHGWWNGAQVGQEVVFATQRKVVNESSVVAGVSAEDGVAGGGHQHVVAGIDESGGQDGEGGFASDGMQDFGFGIDVGNAADFFEIFCGGVFERLAAVVGVSPIFSFACFFVQHSDGVGRGHFIGLTHSQVDDFGFGTGLAGG